MTEINPGEIVFFHDEPIEEIVKDPDSYSHEVGEFLAKDAIGRFLSKSGYHFYCTTRFAGSREAKANSNEQGEQHGT